MTIYNLFIEYQKAAFIVVGLGAASGVAWYTYRKWSSQHWKLIPKEWEEVGEVTQLLIYPIKSARPIPVKSAEATINGLQDGMLLDRSFMVVTEEGRMITGRNVGMLVTLRTEFTNSKLTITVKNDDHVTVNIADVINSGNKILKFNIRGEPAFGVDCGGEVAEWLTTRLFEDGTKVRLMYSGKAKWKRLARSYDSFKFPTFRKDDTTSYNDTSSYCIMTESSLADLNSRLTSPVTMIHFRPPIVIGGTKPYDEDTWEYIKIGDNVVLHLSKPCHRCGLITVDPVTGERKNEHFQELKRYRIIKYPSALAKSWATEPIFGLNCGIDTLGRVSVGDKVFITRAKPPYWYVN